MFLIGAGMIVLSQWLGPRRSREVHDVPYEWGMEPHEIVRGCFSVKFFLIALLFMLFNIERIFLFPLTWSLISLGFFGFAEMATVLLIVLAGLFYGIKQGFCVEACPDTGIPDHRIPERGWSTI